MYYPAHVEPPNLADFLRFVREGGVADFASMTPGLSSDRKRVPKARISKWGSAEPAGEKRAAPSESYLRKLEKGVNKNPSNEIIDEIAAALGLTRAERLHAKDLVRPPHDSPDDEGDPIISAEDKKYADQHLGPFAYRDEASNVLYANAEYYRIFRGIHEAGNLLVWLLTHPESRQIMQEWESEAALAVAWFRNLMTRRPGYPRFATTLKELSSSSTFVYLWEKRQVAQGRPWSGLKVVDPDTGEPRLIRALLTAWPDSSKPVQVFNGSYDTWG